MRFTIPLLFSVLLIVSEIAYSQPFGSSVFLNGTNNYITIPNNSNLNQTATISVEAWIYPCKVQGQNFILNKDWCGGSGNNAYNFRVLNGKLHWKWDIDGCGNGAHAYESILPAIQPNQWQHVVAVHTTSSVTLYLNGAVLPGQLISGSYGSIMQSPEPVRIGVYRDINSAYWGYFQGRIDEVRVWNYALSAAEVLARYNTTLVGNETGLVAYYPMDITGSGAGTLVPNQATLTGSTINGTTVGTTSSPVFSPNSQPLVPVNLGNDTSLCPGQQVNLNASLSGATYLWQNNSTLPTFLVTQPGNYWVQVSLGGCASTDTIVVLQEVLLVDLGPDTGLCPGDILTLNATLPGATYLWDNGTTGPVRAITQPGTYWVSVSRNGCSAADTIQVTLYNTPVVNLGQDTSLCNGQQITLSVSNPGLSVLWSTGASSPTISPFMSGTYWVSVNDGHCTASDTILLNFLPTPIVQLGSDTTLCQGDTLILNATATAATYLWDNGSTAPIRAVSQNGTYWVGVTANGCTGHDSISIDFIPLPPINLGQDTSLCEGTLLNLSPGAIPLTASILWSTGASAHSISPIISGVYWLRVSIGSCEESDTILVEFRPLPHIDLGPDTILCDGDQLVLDASWPGTQHLWSDGSTNPTLAVSQAGTYSVTATADGCSNQDIIDISMVYQPEVYLGEDTTICQGDEILLNAGNGFSTYLWNTGSIGNVLNAGAAGPYWVKVSNQCGEAADTFLLSTKDCEYTIFIPNAFTPWRQDGINDQFLVKATGIAEYYIIIFNRWGGQLYESHSIYEPWDGTYHGKRCPQSVYYYRIDFRLERTNRWHTRQGSITLL